jgi:HEAT repeat protein
MFFRLMNTADALRRQEACLDAWHADLSDREKTAVLDAMWETKTPRYSETLLKIARGQDSSAVRAQAITVLTGIGVSHGAAVLVPMLSSDPDCQVKRQLLALFRAYPAPEALPAIDQLLGDQTGPCVRWPVDFLDRAREARAAIVAANPAR